MQSDSSGNISFGAGAKATGLSLVWGSPDSYNEIQFYSLGSLVASITGSSITGGIALGVDFVTLSLIGGVFDTVTFLSHGQNAFEFANIRWSPNDLVPEVPLPAGMMLLLSGLTGLGFLARRRSKVA